MLAVEIVPNRQETAMLAVGFVSNRQEIISRRVAFVPNRQEIISRLVGFLSARPENDPGALYRVQVTFERWRGTSGFNPRPSAILAAMT